MTATESIAALRGALEAGPTLGKWKFDGYHAIETTVGGMRVDVVSSPVELGCGSEETGAWLSHDTNETNMRFIAAANPEAIRAILDERDSLLARIETLEADAARDSVLHTGDRDVTTPDLLDESAMMLESYATRQRDLGNDSEAAGADAHAYRLRHLNISRAADAKRYQWLRANAYIELKCDSPKSADWKPEHLDAAIDAARKDAK